MAGTERRYVDFFQDSTQSPLYGKEPPEVATFQTWRIWTGTGRKQQIQSRLDRQLISEIKHIADAVAANPAAAAPIDPV